MLLTNLHIRNLAVVAELEIEFGPGLNTITGETGAGKSLILGALQLLLGERASPSVIRQGAGQCEIAALFAASPAYAELQQSLRAFLGDQGIAGGSDADGLLLRRVITASGSRHYINGTAVPLQQLRQLGEWLVDIHGPHDHQSLLQPRCQLLLLDEFAGLPAEAESCRRAMAAAEDARARLAARQQEHLSAEQAERVRFQLAEIDGAEPQEGEDEELNARHRVVANRRRLLELSAQLAQGLALAENSVADQLRVLLRLAQGIEEIDAAAGARFRERLEGAVETAEELGSDLTGYQENLELDEQELTRLEERIGVLQKLKRKYGPGLADVRRHAETLRAQLAQMEERGEQVTQLAAEVAALAAAHLACCTRLSVGRHAAANRLAGAITDKLQRLGFAQGLFAVKLSAAEPGPRGADQIEFCFAPNPGERLLPLRQIASSGEIARVMLAVKTILSTADRVPILVFDEVDANVGGRVAVMVADELHAIADRHQVFCITHLPQIAAAGSCHYRVSKHIADGRTLTDMQRLDAKGREAEITRMLGAEEESATARRHAREMLARGKA